MTAPVFTLAALRIAYGAGLSPGDVMAEVHRRIAALGDPGIFLHLRPLDDLLAEAAALGAFDPDRPLWGIPFAVKDNIDVAGCPTTAACPAFAYTPARDAFVVARLRAAGAIPVGKTNLDQFATGLVGLRTPYPAPRNALDPALVPGGSSSGSAVAVAQGLVAFALGTDTAGSGRVPAALNNIVGLKPTLGALSTTGVVPACRTLDAVSVFALTVDDAHAVFAAAAGFDAEDAYARRIAVAPLGAPPPAPRIGVPSPQTVRFFGDRAAEDAFARDCAALEAMGARIVPLDFAPFHAVAEMLYAGPWVAERHITAEALLARDPEAVHPVIRRILAPAPGLSASDTFRAFYRLMDLRRAIAPLLAGVDLLCVPSIPTLCTCADIAADPVGPNSRLGTYTNFVNLLDLCALAVPTPPRADGGPASATLIAAAGRDSLLASLGAALEQSARRTLGATGWQHPGAPSRLDRAGPGEIELAVCGAHMSGLPLNGELTGAGGRFLRRAQTLPEYRLYSLPGGPPRRPGLLRSREGASIALEVWAMPTSALGGFLAAVPPPLGIGTLRLADGTSPKGFLVEAHAVAEAEDVTAFADWRRVLAEASA